MSCIPIKQHRVLLHLCSFPFPPLARVGQLLSAVRLTTPPLPCQAAVARLLTHAQHCLTVCSVAVALSPSHGHGTNSWWASWSQALSVAVALESGDTIQTMPFAERGRSQSFPPSSQASSETTNSTSSPSHHSSALTCPDESSTSPVDVQCCRDPDFVRAKVVQPGSFFFSFFFALLSWPSRVQPTH